VISASHHLVAGQVVDAREVLFEIVDPERLAVEALAYDPGIGATLDLGQRLAEQTALELKFVGGGRSCANRRCRCCSASSRRQLDGRRRPTLKVIVRTAHEIKGAAVPRPALTQSRRWRDGGVGAHEAERFVARKVRRSARCGQCGH
jgi:hypothetical protein